MSATLGDWDWYVAREYDRAPPVAVVGDARDPRALTPDPIEPAPAPEPIPPSAGNGWEDLAMEGEGRSEAAAAPPWKPPFSALVAVGCVPEGLMGLTHCGTKCIDICKG